MEIRLRAKKNGAHEEAAPIDGDGQGALDQRISHRGFLKMLGTAVGVAGLATAGQLAIPARRVEADDSPPYGTVTLDFLKPNTGNTIQVKNNAQTPEIYVTFDGANQRVGIGTTAPAAATKLDVVGGAVALDWRIDLQTKSGGVGAPFTTELTAKNGSVGIGTTTPMTKLDVFGGQVGLDYGAFGLTRGIRFRNNGQLASAAPAGGGLFQGYVQGFHDVVCVQAGVANGVAFLRSDDALSAGFYWISPNTVFYLGPSFQMRPLTDAAAALQVTNNAGTAFVTFDSLYQRVGIGRAPTNGKLDVGGDICVNNEVAIAWDGIVPVAKRAYYSD